MLKSVLFLSFLIAHAASLRINNKFMSNLSVNQNTMNSQISYNTSEEEFPVQLNVGEKLQNENATHKLVMEPNGNLVLYALRENNKEVNIWSSNTFTDDIENNPYHLVFDDDGHLIIKGEDGLQKWISTDNGESTGPYRLILQEDGNLVVYDDNDKPVWATNSHLSN
jgi:hypothetical protein